ncbi:Retrovirus-related Pol polyprotein from transposon [Dictyocoela roeselum]|nr:Retrovirus-related Pol polyprotein from transposon [Dictyocoela roeselum]
MRKEYPVAIGLQDDVANHISKLLNDGIIQETYSEYISPAFVIKKEQWKTTIGCEHSHLSSITKKCQQFTPNMFELLGRLKDAKIFTSIDLNQGYYQVDVAKKYVCKTGFKILNRTFVFNKMPFGLCNAPATFQRIMNALFKDIPETLVYLDDILVYSSSIEKHYNSLQVAFKILKENRISVNFEKSKFAVETIEFLGHQISATVIQPNIAKNTDITFKRPQTKKQLQKIIGLLNWYRPFVPSLYIKLHDFYSLLKSKTSTIHWAKKHTDIFYEIVEKIKQRQTLHHPDFNKTFTLKTDAFEKGIGAILTQDNKIGGLFSKKYNPQEENYLIVEKEALAIIKAIEHFKPIIYNAPIIIMTDNKNLTFTGDLSKRIN